MEPRVQYAKTSDGVNIAYCATGEGLPLVIANQFVSHVQLEWQLYPHLYGSLGRSFRVIWFDWRGTGLSQRDNLDFSLTARLRDLSAVIDRAGGGAIALAGFFSGVPIAIAYAAQVPDRVSRLVLMDGWAKFADVAHLPAWQAERALRGQEWTIYTETVARVLFGLEDEALAKEWAEYLRSAIDPEALRKVLSEQEEHDVSTLVARLEMPTLVVHNKRNRFVGAQVAQRLAAGIPLGEFLPVDDETYRTIPSVIAAFLEREEAARQERGGRDTALRTVLFTDLVGHTEMMSRLGDERGREVLREHERITREVLKAHGGTEVKTMGDGFMASFGSVTRAVECAVALQRAMETLTPDPSPAGAGQSVFPLKVRCGLNAGEPIEEEGDLFGATVILASRIAAKAEGGEILVADTVRGLCSGKGFFFADRGEFVAKGFEEPVRVYEVRWRD